MADGYAIKSVEEFEEMEGSGDATWRLARKSLEASAFGFNVVDIGPCGQIPEHDETGSGQEEVFCVLQGEGTFVADGEELPAPAGTFVRYSPEVKRTVRNHSDQPIRVMVVGAKPGEGYKPNADWL